MATDLKAHEADRVANFVHAFKSLMALVNDASSVRYTAPPRSYAAKGAGPDPTAEVVMDTSRAALNRAIDDATVILGVAAANIEAATANLDKALDPYTA